MISFLECFKDWILICCVDEFVLGLGLMDSTGFVLVML